MQSSYSFKEKYLSKYWSGDGCKSFGVRVGEKYFADYFTSLPYLYKFLSEIILEDINNYFHFIN